MPTLCEGAGQECTSQEGDRDHEEGCVPKISMDYFFMSKVDESANVNPFIVMLDEDTGEKYARALGHKGLGQEREIEWLIKDMSMELKSWGHPGGDGGHIILKADGEKAIMAVRDALARYHEEKLFLKVLLKARANPTEQWKKPAKLYANL